jgi:type IV pilus assembly protein PilV
MMHSKPIAESSTRSEGGSAILEGLIAILLFSVGIIAIMGLQSVSINAVRDAKYRSDASYVAAQIIGLMWADRGANSVNLPCYSLPNTGTCPSTSSSAARVTWLDSFTTSGGVNFLPGAAPARQEITVDAATSTVTVTIRWQSPQDVAERQFVTVARIRG